MPVASVWRLDKGESVLEEWFYFTKGNSEIEFVVHKEIVARYM